MARFLRWRLVGFAKQLRQKNSRKFGARGPRFRLRSRLTPNVGGGLPGGGGLGGGGLIGISAIKLPKGQRNPPASQSQAPPPKQKKQQKPPPKQKKKGNQSGSGGSTTGGG